MKALPCLNSMGPSILKDLRMGERVGVVGEERWWVRKGVVGEGRDVGYEGAVF